MRGRDTGLKESRRAGAGRSNQARRCGTSTGHLERSLTRAAGKPRAPRWRKFARAHARRGGVVWWASISPGPRPRPSSVSVCATYSYASSPLSRLLPFGFSSAHPPIFFAFGGGAASPSCPSSAARAVSCGVRALHTQQHYAAVHEEAARQGALAALVCHTSRQEDRFSRRARTANRGPAGRKQAAQRGLKLMDVARSLSAWDGGSVVATSHDSSYRGIEFQITLVAGRVWLAHGCAVFPWSVARRTSAPR